MAGALVGGAVLSASLQVLFDRLAPRGLIDYVWRRKDEEVLLKKLKASLVFADAVLSDAEHKHITDLTAKGWLNQLEETVADAQNLLNAIEDGDSPASLRGRSRSKLLEDMLDRLELLARQRDAFGVIELGAQPLRKSTTSLMREPNIYGRDEDMEAIVRLLLSDDAPGDPICTITIVGVPGIGKTTLAQSVYNDNSVEQYFDFRVWICVSNRLDVYSITKTILEAITMVTYDIKDLNLLQLRLREELAGRKLLLVLDDVCTEDCTEWNTLLSPLRFCAPASKTIVTTQGEITAAMTCTLPAYPLSPLSYEDCWLIFAQHAFDSVRGAPDPNLEAVGREIVKKCGGLPLVAKTLGVLFRSKPNHGEWNEILTDSTWDASHDMNSFVQTLSITSGMGKWRRKLLERKHDESFFPRGVNQFRGTYQFIKIKRAWLSIVLVLWVIIMSIVSALVYKTLNDYHITKMEAALGSMCDTRAWMLQNEFAVNVNHVHALANLVARFYYQQNATDIKQMREALASYMDSTTFERPLFSGVAYAERVVHSERENFEKRHGWKIRDIMTFDSRPVQEEYAPVVFCQEDIAHVNSVDMLSGKEDRDNALKARAVGRAVISGPFRLLRWKRIGVILTYPVYRSKLLSSMGVEERIRDTAGYIGGLFQFESLVENVLWQLGNQTVLDLLVTVYDITNSSHSLMMYGQKYVESNWSMMHESKLELGDPFRKHLMICRYRDATSLSWIAALVAVLIITIGSLAPCMLHAAAIHMVKLRQASLRIRGLEVQLQDANTANSQLQADASEIKQPAYIIIQTLAMLLDTELSSIQRGYIQIAQACGKRQIALADKTIESPNLPVITHTI